MTNWSSDTLLLGSFDDRLCDERIQRILQSYANYGIMDYLRGLAHNFELNWVYLITIHSILDIYSSKYMVSVIFQYYGTRTPQMRKSLMLYIPSF